MENINNTDFIKRRPKHLTLKTTSSTNSNNLQWPNTTKFGSSKLHSKKKIQFVKQKNSKVFSNQNTIIVNDQSFQASKTMIERRLTKSITIAKNVITKDTYLKRKKALMSIEMAKMEEHPFDCNNINNITLYLNLLTLLIIVI